MAQVEFGEFEVVQKSFTNSSFAITPELARLNVTQLMLYVSSR
jgi:hypothetical protein